MGGYFSIYKRSEPNWWAFIQRSGERCSLLHRRSKTTFRFRYVSFNFNWSLFEELFIVADCGLSLIPLVQTFGHLEYVLKHDEWRALREVESYPSSMCPSHSGTIPLIQSMIKQIIAFHPNIQYVHIGADEVSCFIYY